MYARNSDLDTWFTAPDDLDSDEDGLKNETPDKYEFETLEICSYRTWTVYTSTVLQI